MDIIVKRKFYHARFWPLVLLHVLGLVGIVYGIAYHGFSVRSWIVATVLFVISSFCLSVGYHRYFIHRSFKCTRVLQYMLAIGGALAVAGTIMSWRHHIVHHAHTDEPDLDPHTPLQYRGIKGFLWSHIGWLCYVEPIPTDYRGDDYLKRDPVAQWQERWYIVMLLASYVVPFLIAGWDGLMLGGFVRVMVYFHAMCCVNSVGHTFGSKPRKADGSLYSEDISRDNIWLAIPTSGETYHARHHAFPNSAFFAWRWYEFDPGKWVLIILEKLGVVWDIKRPDWAG